MRLQYLWNDGGAGGSGTPYADTLFMDMTSPDLVAHLCGRAGKGLVGVVLSSQSRQPPRGPSEVPVLCSNCDFQGAGLGPQLQRWTVLTVGGLKVGLTVLEAGGRARASGRRKLSA